MLREALSWILIISIVCTGQVQAAGPAGGPADPAAPPEPVRIDDLRSEIDRSDFELEALGERLDWDAATIVRFVREKIYFEQYVGLLRGAQGTLMSRAGNSLDQSVLLATLLKDAGFDARILRGRLSRDQARTLLRLMRPISKTERPDSAEPAPVVGARTAEGASAIEFDHLFGGMDATFGPDWELPSSDGVGQAVERVVGVLADGGVNLGDPDSLADLEAEAQDYFWVEYRSGPSERWKSEQPVFHEDEGGFSSLEYSKIFIDEIPPELQHRVRVEAFVEQKFGNDLNVYPVMDPWEMPAANLMGTVLSFVNYPSGLTEETLEAGWDAIVEKTFLILPILNGSLAPGARGFNLDGTIYSLDAAGMDRFNAKALFETLGTKMEKAVGALGSLGEDEPSELEPVALTAQWVDYTFIAPGGEETRQRRMILDRLGPDARARVDFSKFDAPSDFRELIAAQTFVVNGGQLANEYLKDQYLTNLEATLKKDVDASGFDGVLLLYKLFEEDPGRQPALISYRPAPNLVVRGIGPDPENKDRFIFYTDIVNNARRSLQWTPEAPVPDPVANLRQGIWESFTERLAIAGSSYQIPGDIRRMEASWGAAKADRLLLTQDQPQVLSAVPLPDDLKARISADLADGFIVIASPLASESPDHRSWWRVDASTGVTLGMGPNGRGESLMGYVIVLGLVGATIIAALLHTVQYAVDVYECASDATGGGSIPTDESENHPQTQCRCEVVREHRRMRAGIAAIGFCKVYQNLSSLACQKLSQCLTDGSGNHLDEYMSDTDNNHDWMTRCQHATTQFPDYPSACSGSSP